MNRSNQLPKCKDCGEEFWPHGLTRRFCLTCATARNNRESAKKKERNKRTVRRPKIKGWEKKRAIVAQERFCGACACELPEGKSPAVDHIIPAAIVAEFNKNLASHLERELSANQPKLSISVSGSLYDAEDPRNLLPVCSICHGRKRKAEILLEKGDVLGYTQEVNRIGYPMDRVKEALRLYGLLGGPPNGDTG